jgi:hypothetical protein
VVKKGIDAPIKPGEEFWPCLLFVADPQPHLEIEIGYGEPERIDAPLRWRRPLLSDSPAASDVSPGCRSFLFCEREVGQRTDDEMILMLVSENGTQNNNNTAATLDSVAAITGRLRISYCALAALTMSQEFSRHR